MFSAKLFERLKHAYSIAILTGAGISAESGVPTFRGKDGLWNNHDVKQLATTKTLKDNPELFWEFYHWRRKILLDVAPNLGHYALVDMEKYFKDFSLITQNVDNLHFQAGSKSVYELHGNIMKTVCTSCDYKISEKAGSSVKKGIPKCPKCGEIMRPGIILFGDSLPEQTLQKAQEASAGCEVFLSIGTSGLVEPAATLPYIAKGNGAYLVEINKEKTPLSDSADEVILGESGKILPMLFINIEKLK